MKAVYKKRQINLFFMSNLGSKNLVKSNGNAGFKKHIRLIEKIFKNLCIF